MADLRLTVKNASYAPDDFVRVITSVKDPVCEDEATAIHRTGNIIFCDFTGSYESLRDVAQKHFKGAVTLPPELLTDARGAQRREVVIDLGPKP